jgi:very-short-patch-repair endonuclease
LSWRDGYVLLQGTTWEVVPQYEELAYRLDFAIFYPKGKVAVEVDGHEWHERTKEQAARDKQRDRELQTAGWFVLRFTGSEVFKDADACVTEVRKFIRERVGP